ncbi:sorting nexin-7-like [Anticarsia gemmatalis]|uniref:sorting nexin-7-like n=1 Tax=Anticarsia gemmatalis TaxID=129554 RepID=UPI003F766647
MASESSSAVLELNDADTEDTEATTVTDDTHEGVPLIMEHGYDIAVKVDAPMKQLSTLETFVTYRVRCVCARWPTPTHVRRRYNHFKLLHKRLSASHPLVAAPPLPPLHSARQQLDRYSPAFVAVRTYALNAFLDRVAKHPILTHSEDFRIFLTTPDDELDKVFKNENSALNLWGISNALYGSGETKTANGPRVKDPEFTSAADYLQSLQQKLTTLCALTTKLHKSTVNMGNELMGMKRACDAWSPSARGRTARACGALAAGAHAARAACARAPAPIAHRAVLPLLAQYAAAHTDKIHKRDAIHAAYVAGTNTTDDLHNRLEQASEALRSELSDWIPKTHTEIKSLLLDLADRQVNLHTQTVLGWEHALKLATESNLEDIFKTVSKTAVQNLSPSRCRSEMSPTETEKDLDDYSDEFDDEENKKIYKNGDVLESNDCSDKEIKADPLTDFTDVDLS